MSTRPWAAVLLCLLALRAFGAEPAVTDRFPAGRTTPEGAACDLARAFIRDDPTLFLSTCVEPYGGAPAQLAYHRFLEGIVVQMKAPSASGTPAPDAPKSIARCFAARHLSQVSAPAIAAAGFQDVMFVDVVASAQSGSTQICRTLVIKGKDGKWKVDPQPDQSPQLSAGLDEESASTQELAASPGR